MLDLTGLSDIPWWGWLPVPVLFVSGMNFLAAQKPWGRHWVCTVLWSLFLAGGLRWGRYVDGHWQVPMAIWIVGVCALPWAIVKHRSTLMILAWLGCLFVCVAAVLGRWRLAGGVNDGLLVFGLGGWCVSALAHWVWPRYREPPPSAAADEAALQEHLDSPSAQEAADKYTRE